MSQVIPSTADAVICGAGMAGIAAAYYLRQHGLTNVTIIDQDSPLSRTSSRAAECYRTWWGDRVMGQFIHTSISLMQELAHKSGNRFQMDKRGYLFVSSNNNGLNRHLQEYLEKRDAEVIGHIRVYLDTVDGSDYRHPVPAWTETEASVDWLIGKACASAHSYLSSNIISALHVRHCGCLDARSLGAYLLEQANATVVRGQVIALSTDNQGISEVNIAQGTQVKSIETRVFINAAGPWAASVAELLGQKLPLTNLLREKIVFPDYAGCLRRDAPMTVCSDALPIRFDGNEMKLLDQHKTARGTYVRPIGLDNSLLIGWAYENEEVEPPIWPPDSLYQPRVELVKRLTSAASSFIPGMGIYAEMAEKEDSDFLASVRHDGGYYAETTDNLPLIGPTPPVSGTFQVAGLGGFGIMGSCAAGDLIARWVTHSQLPNYAEHLTMESWQRLQGNRSGGSTDKY